MAIRDEILRFAIEAEGGDQLKSLTKDIDSVAQAAAAGEPKAQALMDELGRLSQATNAVNSLGKLKIQLADTGEQLGAAKRRFDELNATFGEAGPKTSAATKALTKAGAEIERLAKLETQLSVAVQKATGTIEKHGLDVNNLGRAQQVLADRTQQAMNDVRAFGAAAANAGKNVKDTAKNADTAGASFGKLRENVNSAGASMLRMTGLASAISAALGAAGIGSVFSDAVNSATSFEQILTTIGAVTGANAAEMAKFKQAAEDATETNKFSAQEAAGALLELAKASGDAATATAQLAPTLNLAQAAGIGTAEAATIMTTTLTQFGLAASEATRVADLFVAEANSTEDSVSQLGLAMSYVAPLAKQLGLSLEDTTAIIGALAKEGFKGERAGTALRNVFSALLDPASKFKGELRGLGINTSNFTEIIMGLVKAGGRGKAALLALDAEATPAITALVEKGGAGLAELNAALGNVGGTAERQSRKMGESFEGATARLRNAFDQIRRDLVEPLLSPLGDQADDVAKRLRAFAETDEFTKIRDSVKTFVTQATAALIEFGKSVDYTALSAKIESFVKDSSEFFTSLRENVQTVLAALDVAGSTISFLFNGIQTVILGAATVIATALALGARSIQRFVEAASLLPGVAGGLAGAVEKIKGVVVGLDGVVLEFAERTKKNAAETAEAFGKLQTSIEAAGNAGEKAAPKLNEAGDAGKAAADGLKQAGNELNLFPDYSAGAAEAVTRVVGPVQDLGRDAALTAGHITRFSSEAQKLGGGPLAAAEAAVRKANDALSDLVLSGNAAPAALRAAAAGAREAQASLDRLRASASGAAAGSKELELAYQRLGVVSQEQLEKAAAQAQKDFEAVRASAGTTTEGINKTREAFIAYAQSALAAAATSDAATRAQVESTLRNLAAQVQALQQFDALIAKQGQAGKAAEDTGRKTKKAGEDGAKALDKTKDAADGAKKGVEDAGKAAQSATVSFEGIGRASLKAVADMYSLVLARRKSAAELDITIKQAKDRLAEQQVQVDGLARAWANLDDAGAQAMINTAGGADRAAGSLRTLANEARAGRSTFDELDQSTLNNLAAAADAAAGKIQAIIDKAREAKAALRGMADSAQDEIDRIRGNEQAIEDRQFQERLRQIEAEAAAAGDAGRAEAERARAAANELHQLRLEQIRKEQAERSGGGGGRGGGGSDGGGSPPPAPPPNRPNGGGGAGAGITFNFNGLVVTGTKDQVANELARLIAPATERLRRLGGA